MNDNYPDEEGWIIREFDTEPVMLAWIADNQNDIELIQFEGADQWIELHPDTTSKKEPVAPFFEWALALEKSWDAPLPPKRPPKIGNSAVETLYKLREPEPVWTDTNTSISGDSKHNDPPIT